MTWSPAPAEEVSSSSAGLRPRGRGWLSGVSGERCTELTHAYIVPWRAWVYVHTLSDPLLVGKVQLSARTIVNLPDTGAAVFDLAGRTFGVEWTGGLRRQK